jgi:hypothetical protein
MNKIQTQDRKIVMGFRVTSINNTFDVYYSTDGTNYYKALINNRVTLASIGANAVVCIPVDATQLKLVNTADPSDISIEQLTPKYPNGLTSWTDGYYYSYMNPYNAITGTPDGSGLYVWRSSKPIYETLFYQYPSGSWQESSATCIIGKSMGTAGDDRVFGPGLAGAAARWYAQSDAGALGYEISVSASYGESVWNVTPSCLR